MTSSVRSEHIPLLRFWDLINRVPELSGAEREHMTDCDRCIRMLGICSIAKSFDDAQRIMAEEFGD